MVSFRLWGLALGAIAAAAALLAALPRGPGAARTGCRIGPGARCAGSDLSGQDLRHAWLGQRILQGQELEDDAGTGALLVDTDFRGADLRGSDLVGVVMQRGSLVEARLAGARSAGSLWMDVPMGGTICPNGQRARRGCPGLPPPGSSAELRRAEARLASQRARACPHD